MKRNELKEKDCRVVESRFPVANVETCIVYHMGPALAGAARYEIMTFENGNRIPKFCLLFIPKQYQAKEELAKILKKVKNHYCN